MTTATRPRPKRRRPRMTETEAVSFPEGEKPAAVARFAANRDARAASGAHPADCTCQAYADAFTFERWKAQGLRVCKGAKGFINPGYRPERDSAGNKTGKLLRVRSYLYCRCQVASERGQPFGWTVPPDRIETERAAFKRNGDSPKTDPIPKPTPEPTPSPAHLSLPQEWLDRLMFEANQGAEESHRVIGVNNLDELRRLNATLRARHRLAVWAPGAMMDPIDVANRVHEALEPAGVGVALVRELTADQANKCKRAGVQTVNVGEIDFGTYRARCTVARIIKKG